MEVDPDQAVELAASAGLVLDGWQQELLRLSLQPGDDGWAYRDVGAIVARQNGKGAILEARELVGLFLDDDCKLIIHTAHLFDTSLEAFVRLLDLIQNTPELARQVRSVKTGNGKESITLLDGSRIVYKARSKSSGRGWSCDLLVLDEAMMLDDVMLAALVPTLSARPNPQVWFTGSAVDQEVHDKGFALARVRERGRAGDPTLAYVEFAADATLDELLEHPERLDDETLWEQANPAYGVRITAEAIAHERRTMSDRAFAVERLGAGDWPVTDPDAVGVIPAEVWRSLIDKDSTIAGPRTLAFDVTPSRSHGAISVAGRREDDLLHVEVIDHREGTGWMADRIAQLVSSHDVEVVRCDERGPAASLLHDLAARGVLVHKLDTSEAVQACGEFIDMASQDRLRHGGQPALNSAVAGAVKRPVGESFMWARSRSSADISPLVACTLAGWASAPLPAQEVFFAFG